MSDNKITLATPDDELPVIPRASAPLIRKPQPKPFYNPLKEIDFDSIPDKQQAYLLGYINGLKDKR